jgi:hypothetical protein
MFATSSGLVVVYTVAKREAEFVHHCSVSTRGGVTAHTVGSTFLLLVVRLLGLPAERMDFHFGQSTVHHGEVAVDEAEHGVLSAAPVLEITPANIAELRADVMESREGVRWR